MISHSVVLNIIDGPSAINPGEWEHDGKPEACRDDIDEGLECVLGLDLFKRAQLSLSRSKNFELKQKKVLREDAQKFGERLSLNKWRQEEAQEKLEKQQQVHPQTVWFL